MNCGGKTCWKSIHVEGPSGGGALDATERLAALYRFQNGERTGDLRFVRGGLDGQVTDPAEVDWDTFPVLAALEAVTRDEIRRLRTLGAEPGLVGEPLSLIGGWVAEPGLPGEPSSLV